MNFVWNWRHFVHQMRTSANQKKTAIRDRAFTRLKGTFHFRITLYLLKFKPESVQMNYLDFFFASKFVKFACTSVCMYSLDWFIDKIVHQNWTTFRTLLKIDVMCVGGFLFVFFLFIFGGKTVSLQKQLKLENHLNSHICI